MKLIKASTQILTEINEIDVLKTLESVARTCYKSEDKITSDGESAKKIVNLLLSRNHEAMLEFFDITVKFTIDRGVSHEVVRHRIASYAQESTRYCNYIGDKFGGFITCIDIEGVMTLKLGSQVTHPVTGEKKIVDETMIMDWYGEWRQAMEDSEKHYLSMVNNYCPAELARSVLPNSVKTEINVKMNLREWRHFFKLRTSKAAHPQMREITIPLLEQFKDKLPLLFKDIEIK